MNPEQKVILKSFIPPLFFIALLWIIKIIEITVPINFDKYGVLPRHFEGLIGIITSPLIHGDFEHLISNSIPLLILSAGLIYFYKEVAAKVFFLVYFLSGFWLWLIGRESYHIGASGVLYGLTTFIFFSGILRRHTGLMALSLIVVFLYGGLIWGIFPLFKQMSWEAHLCGSLAGILLAFVYRKEGPQRKEYEWESEEEENNDESAIQEGEEKLFMRHMRIPAHYPKQQKKPNNIGHCNMPSVFYPFAY